MVQLQIINKILSTADISIVENNLLTADYFAGYEKEFEFITDHYKRYGVVPDKLTFRSAFPDFDFTDVTEPDSYLVDTLREEYLYHQSVPILQKSAELLKTDSNVAVEYMLTAIKQLQPSYNLGGVDIIAEAEQRYEQFLERKTKQDEWYFTTGFPELDDAIHGIQRGEEYFVIFARTNQGKSWVLEKMCTHVWQLGFNVGYISPEMGASSVGYRFDTLFNHFSNSGLTWGNKDIDESEYENYINKLKQYDNKFIVSTPMDFGNKITVTKIRNWVKQFKLDMVAIDGITYLSDERYNRGDTKTISLTNISEDLMSLSIELKIPILVVVQANRSGVVDSGTTDTPELESIRDSDGISHNASKILSIHQREFEVLDMTVKKQRFGVVGTKLSYNWNINLGEWEYIPDTPKKAKKDTMQDVTDVF